MISLYDSKHSGSRSMEKHTRSSLLPCRTWKSCKSLQSTGTKWSGQSPISRRPNYSLLPRWAHLAFHTLDSSSTGLSSRSGAAQKSGTSCESCRSSVAGVTLLPDKSLNTFLAIRSGGSALAFRTALTLGTNLSDRSYRIMSQITLMYLTLLKQARL